MQTVVIKKIANTWYIKYKYWQTRYSRIKKKDAISEIKKAFDDNRNIDYFGHVSFEEEKEKMKCSRYFFEYEEQKND